MDRDCEPLDWENDMYGSHIESPTSHVSETSRYERLKSPVPDDMEYEQGHRRDDYVISPIGSLTDEIFPSSDGFGSSDYENIDEDVERETQNRVFSGTSRNEYLRLRPSPPPPPRVRCDHGQNMDQGLITAPPQQKVRPPPLPVTQHQQLQLGGVSTGQYYNRTISSHYGEEAMNLGRQSSQQQFPMYIGNQGGRNHYFGVGYENGGVNTINHGNYDPPPPPPPPPPPQLFQHQQQKMNDLCPNHHFRGNRMQNTNINPMPLPALPSSMTDGRGSSNVPNVRNSENLRDENHQQNQPSRNYRSQSQSIAKINNRALYSPLKRTMGVNSGKDKVAALAQVLGYNPTSVSNESSLILSVLSYSSPRNPTNEYNTFKKIGRLFCFTQLVGNFERFFHVKNDSGIKTYLDSINDFCLKKFRNPLFLPNVIQDRIKEYVRSGRVSDVEKKKIGRYTGKVFSEFATNRYPPKKKKKKETETCGLYLQAANFRIDYVLDNVFSLFFHVRGGVNISKMENYNNYQKKSTLNFSVKNLKSLLEDLLTEFQQQYSVNMLFPDQRVLTDYQQSNLSRYEQNFGKLEEQIKIITSSTKSRKKLKKGSSTEKVFRKSKKRAGMGGTSISANVVRFRIMFENDFIIAKNVLVKIGEEMNIDTKRSIDCKRFGELLLLDERRHVFARIGRGDTELLLRCLYGYRVQKRDKELDLLLDTISKNL